MFLLFYYFVWPLLSLFLLLEKPPLEYNRFSLTHITFPLACADVCNCKGKLICQSNDKPFATFKGLPLAVTRWCWSAWNVSLNLSGSVKASLVRIVGHARLAYTYMYERSTLKSRCIWNILVFFFHCDYHLMQLFFWKGL